VIVTNEESLEKSLYYDGPFAFAILDVDAKEPDPKLIAEKITSIIGDRPFIFVGSQINLNTRVEDKAFQKNPATDLLSKPINPLKFFEVINTAYLWAKDLDFAESLIDVNPDDYLSIRIRSFYLYNAFPHDVYMEITPEKFMKVIRRNQTYTHSEILKFIKRGIRVFYLKKDDQLNFLEDSIHELMNIKLDYAQMNELICFHIESFSILQQYIRSFGVVASVQDFSEYVFNTMLKMFDYYLGDYKLILSRFPFRDGGLPEKSILVAYTACALLKSLSWWADSTVRKMLLISMLHDVVLLDDDLIVMEDANNDKFNNLSLEKQQLFFEHPSKSAGLANQFRRYPDCSFVIEQHHEKADGSGMPNNLNALNITTFSCTFILAHSFATKLYIQGVDGFSLEKIISELAVSYDIGNFKEPLKHFSKYLKKSF